MQILKTTKFTMEKLLQRCMQLGVRSLSKVTPHEQQLKSAAIIVIGDEILKGEVVDTNSHYITSRLHKMGIKVKKISVIGDIHEDISEEVKHFSKKYNYVITSGGIGPTHDDITFEAVARAFNEPIILHPELVKICSQFYKTTDTNAPGMKLARVPKSARLTFPQVGVQYPNVRVQNVYMFPGIPQLLQKSFDSLCTTLFPSSSKFYTEIIYCNVTEDKIAPILDKLVKEFPDVLIGSYPQLAHSNYKVKITFESLNEASSKKARAKLLQSVPKDFIANYQ